MLWQLGSLAAEQHGEKYESRSAVFLWYGRGCARCTRQACSIRRDWITLLVVCFAGMAESVVALLALVNYSGLDERISIDLVCVSFLFFFFIPIGGYANDVAQKFKLFSSAANFLHFRIEKLKSLLMCFFRQKRRVEAR